VFGWHVIPLPLDMCLPVVRVLCVLSNESFVPPKKEEATNAQGSSFLKDSKCNNHLLPPFSSFQNTRQLRLESKTTC
jgi:hypothetical protein